MGNDEETSKHDPSFKAYEDEDWRKRQISKYRHLYRSLVDRHTNTLKEYLALMDEHTSLREECERLRNKCKSLQDECKSLQDECDALTSMFSRKLHSSDDTPSIDSYELDMSDDETFEV